MVFDSMLLPDEPDAVAPDGSDVRVLLSVGGGSMAHFEFAPRHTSPAIQHRTVDELWYVLAGMGEMWLRGDGCEAVVELRPGACVAIPVGTTFQVRTCGDEPLAVIGATIPPWPGEGEATIVPGKWEPTLEPGPH